MDFSELNYDQLVVEFEYGRTFTPGYREALLREIHARERAYLQQEIEGGRAPG